MRVHVSQARHGKFLTLEGDFISSCLVTYGEWAERETSFLLSLVGPGDNVIEVGANLGAQAVPLARRIGPRGTLLCVEAQRSLHQLLCANVVLNELENVIAEHAVASERSGTIRLRPSNLDQPGNLGGYEVPAHVDSAGAPTRVVTVDALAEFHGLGPVRLLKADVEGMEDEVLRGASGVLERDRPHVFFEAVTWTLPERRPRGEALLGQLRALGYSLAWFCPVSFNPNNFRGALENRLGSFGDVNVIAAPPGSSLPRELPGVRSTEDLAGGLVPWISSLPPATPPPAGDAFPAH